MCYIYNVLYYIYNVYMPLASDFKVSTQTCFVSRKSSSFPIGNPWGSMVNGGWKIP